MKKLASTFVVYGFVGAIATIVDWGSFYVMNSTFGWHYILAVCISFILGSVTNFSLNKHITFKNTSKKLIRQYLLHTFVSILSLSVTILLMLWFIQGFHMIKFPARMLTTFIVLFFNFFMHKYLTFGIYR